MLLDIFVSPQLLKKTLKCQKTQERVIRINTKMCLAIDLRTPLDNFTLIYPVFMEL